MLTPRTLPTHFDDLLCIIFSTKKSSLHIWVIIFCEYDFCEYVVSTTVFQTKRVFIFQVIVLNTTSPQCKEYFVCLDVYDLAIPLLNRIISSSYQRETKNENSVHSYNLCKRGLINNTQSNVYLISRLNYVMSGVDITWGRACFLTSSHLYWEIGDSKRYTFCHKLSQMWRRRHNLLLSSSNLNATLNAPLFLRTSIVNPNLYCTIF